jgi:seryl-tRNA synthetase
MLDIKFIRQNQKLIEKAARDKKIPLDLKRLLRVDQKRTKLIKEVDTLRQEKNEITQKIAQIKDSSKKLPLIKKMRLQKNNLRKKQKALAAVEQEFHKLMLWVPNIPAPDVPIGKDESQNVEVKKWGRLPKFDFKIRDHVELGERLDLIDLNRGVKLGGFRSFFTKNEAVLMEYGLLDYTLRFMIKQGFTPMTVPYLVKPGYFYGTGFFPFGEEDHYKTQDDTCLIGTAEVSLTAYFAGETLDAKNLPVKLVGISPCFRREVGSYGKDTRGIFRTHQFNKVEQVVLCRADKKESENWHEKMLSFSEKIVQDLKLPYRVMLMCTGDMGAGQVKKYDLEVWFPAQEKYRETHSDSYFFDFQARRLNIKYQTTTGEKKFVHTLNNTVIATPRILGAILENYQQKDSSVLVPKILQPYVGKTKISLKKDK